MTQYQETIKIKGKKYIIQWIDVDFNTFGSSITLPKLFTDRAGHVVKEETFDELMERAKELWSKLIVGEDELGNFPKINKKIEMIFGHPMKLSEVMEDQKDLLGLVVMELEEMASKM